MKKHRLRLRWLLGFLIFLLLGAILNVAVAWGICLCLDPLKAVTYPPKNAIKEQGNLFIGEVDVYCIRIETPVFLGARGQWEDSSLSPRSVLDALIRGGPLVSVVPWRGPYDSTSGSNSITTFVAGWPAFTMWFETVHAPTSAVPGIEHGLILKQLPAWRVKPAVGIVGSVLPRTVPLGIHCRGFLINTLFYAVILWLLFPGRYMLRRHRRIRRGQCGQCGYMVAPNLGVPGASPNCPECGTPISPDTSPIHQSRNH